MNKIYLIILSCIFFVSCQSSSDQMTILTEDYPPLSFEDKGIITGYGTDIVNELQKRLKTNYPIDLNIWSEAYEIALTKPNVLIYTIEKTPEREQLFYWIGPIGVNESYFYMKKSIKIINFKKMQDFRKLKAIATCTNWFNEQYLIKAGFTNLVSMPHPEDNVKLVMNGKANATVLTNLTARKIVQNAGFKADDLVPVHSIMSSEFYIGISKKTSLKIVNKWKNAFQSMVADSTFYHIKEKWSLL